MIFPVGTNCYEPALNRRAPSPDYHDSQTAYYPVMFEAKMQIEPKRASMTFFSHDGSKNSPSTLGRQNLDIHVMLPDILPFLSAL